MPRSYSSTKLARAREVIRQLETGPASLAERSPFTPGGDAGDEARKALLDNYKLWVSTWILPELKALVPELAKAIAAERAAATASAV